MTCDFEALCDYLDGQAPAGMAAHLEECATCREALATLQGLGTTLVPEDLPGEEFVLRTRRRMLAAGPHAPTWWDWLRGQNPVAALLRLKAARRVSRVPQMLSILLLFGAPALYFAQVKDPLNAQIFLGTLGLAVLGGLPWYYFKSEVSLLTSLRRGRCLEEILTANVTPREIVDTLACYSLRDILKAGLPVVAVLLPGARLFGTERELAHELALAWLPAVVLFFFIGSYLTQFMATWSRDGERTSPLQLGLASAVLLSTGLILAPIQALLTSDHGWLALAATIGGGLWLTLAGRQLAILGLRRTFEVERWNKPRTRRRSRWMRAWSDNPIVVRETARQGGWLGLYAVAGLMPCLWALVSTRPEYSGIFWGSLGAAAALVFVTSCLRTLPAVVGEKEKRTWESLLQTGLSPQEFVRGWTQVGSYRLILALLPSLATILMVGRWLPEVVADDPSAALLYAWAVVLVALLLVRTGTLVGLALSTTSASQRDAGTRLVGVCALGVIAGLWVWGIGMALVMGIGAVGWVDTSDLWFEPLVQLMLPLASLSLVALGAGLASRWLLARNLGLGNPAPVLAWKVVLRRGVFAGLALAALVLVSLEGWIWSYRVTDPILARKLSAQARARAEARRSVPPERNGYTALAPLVAISGPSADILGQLAERDYNPNWVPTDTDVADLERSDVLNRVRKCLAQLELVYPEDVWRADLNGVGAANTQGLRRLSRALLVYDRYLEKRGQYKEAIEVDLLLIGLGRRSLEQGGAEAGIVALDTEKEALFALNRVLSSHPPVAARLTTLEAELLSQSPPARLVMERVEEELPARLELVDKCPLPLPLGHIPGLVGRERKVVVNFWLALRPRLEGALRGEALQEPRQREFWRDNHSLMGTRLGWDPSLALVRAYWQTVDQLGAARLLGALHLYRDRHGDYPERLEQALSPSGQLSALEVPEGEDWISFGLRSWGRLVAKDHTLLVGKPLFRDPSQG